VDDVNEIFNINAEEKHPLPLALGTKKDSIPTHDMKEIVMVGDTKLIVLDIRSILKRVIES
jgi:hypothetical protein